MATKVHHVQAMPGVRDLYTLLDVFRNAETYAAMLDELEAKRKEVNDLIEMSGKASEIPSLHQAAQVKLQQAEAALAEAQEKTQTIINDAKKHVEEVSARMAAKVAELNERVEKFNAERKATEASLAERALDLERRLNDVTAREKRAAELQRHNEELNAQLKERMAKIEQLRAEL